MFSVDDFQKLKTHIPSGSLGLGFSLNPQVRISISDNTTYGRGWEMRILDEPTRRMCILTETAGQLTPDYRHLVPLAQHNGYDFQPLTDPDFERLAQSLYVETLAHLERKKTEELEANRRSTEKLRALANDTRWRELVGLLVADPARAEKIAKATGRAFTQPETFLRRLRLPRVTDDLPWLALIAALRKDKLLVELDWKADEDEVATGLRKLSSVEWTAEADLSTEALLSAAGCAFEAAGMMLVSLDAGGDSYPTTLINAEGFEAAVAHAAAFGWQIKRHFA